MLQLTTDALSNKQNLHNNNSWVEYLNYFETSNLLIKNKTPSLCNF